MSAFAVLVWNSPAKCWDVWADGYDTFSTANRDAAELCFLGRHAIVRRSPVVFPAMLQVAA